MQLKSKLDSITGELSIWHVHGPAWPMEKASRLWQLKNKLTRSYISGWIGYHVAAPMAGFFGIATLKSELSLIHTAANGIRTDYGIVCRKLVTTAFVNYMVDQLQAEASQWGDFKFHESGTGVTNPAVSDTGIETAAANSGEVTGSQTEGAANIYKSVGTCSYTGIDAVTEHVLTNVSGTGDGICMDRHEFGVITTANGDTIEFTYQLTVAAGG